MKPLALLALLALAAAPARAQEDVPADAPADAPAVSTAPLRLSGPRFGVTVVTGETADRLEEEFEARPVFTQFGWQFENRLFRLEDSGLTGVTEWVPLVGGLEQGLFLPSLTFLVGLRTRAGTEIGIGPNVSASGAGLAIATGISQAYGELNFPVNASVVLSDDGVRASLLVGFTLAR